MSITNKALEGLFVTGTDRSWYHSSFSVFRTREGALSLIAHYADPDRGGWVFWEVFFGDSLQDLCNQIRDEWLSVSAAARGDAADIEGRTLAEADDMMSTATDPAMIAGLLDSCGSGYLFDPYVVQFAQTDREFLLAVTDYENN